MSRRLFVLVTALALAAVPFVASAQTVPWQATLNGASEVPANASTATGTFTATLDATAQTLTWTLSVPAITNATAAHIHAGAAGVNGGIVLTLFAAPSSGPASSINVSGTARPADLVGTLAGNWAGFVSAAQAGGLYVNVHTSAFAPGEIRGQVAMAQTQPAPTASPTAAATTVAPSAPKTGTAGLLGEGGMGAAGAAGLVLLALVTVVGGRLAVSRKA